MLVFIDESGDSGLKIKEGSSRYFTVALVLFSDNEEAQACDRRIALLKHELGWDNNEEFHFKRNSNRVRSAFLQAVSPYEFFYYGIVINKDPKKLWGDGFKDKHSFYKYACNLVFQNAHDDLEKATVVIDKSGNQEFRNQLATYLRRKINNEGKKCIGKVKMQRSNSNNLLQLADYIAGMINRYCLKKKRNHEKYHRMIAHREMNIQVWPK